MASAFGQQLSRINSLSPPTVALVRSSDSKHSLSENVGKTANCIDTLFYPYAKMLGLGNGQSDLNALGLEASYNDKLAQIYENAGTITITGAEVGVANGVANGSLASGITALVQVYSVNAQNNITTLLGSGTVFVNNAYGGQATFKRLSFSSPITVTGKYAIAVSTTTPGGVLACFTGKQASYVSYYEGLSRFYTSYQNLNQWTLVSNVWADDYNNPIDVEPMLHPIVSYSVNLSGIVSPAVACTGDLVTFTNTTSDSTVLNRMTHAGIFKKHWGLATNDSIFAWSHSGLYGDASLAMWQSNASWTYNQANSYTPAILFEGGFGTSCIDAVFYNVTINDCTPPLLDDCTISGLNTVCTNESITLVSSSSDGTWNAVPSGIVTVLNGVVTAGSNTGTVTISYSGSSTCNGTATHQVTITDCTPPPPSLDNCSLSGANTVCKNDNITLTASAQGGIWVSSNSNIVSVNNGIVTGVNVGSATISYGGSQNCNGTASVVITVTDCGAADGGNENLNCNIVGANTVCMNENITLVVSRNDGSWSVTPEGIVSILNGVVTGVGVGSAIVSYSGGSCSNIATYTVTVDKCESSSGLGVDDELFANITISPNPTTDRIVISGLPKLSTISISDINGKMLFTKINNDTIAELFIGEFVNGVYFVKIQSKKINGVRKIVLHK